MLLATISQLQIMFNRTREVPNQRAIDRYALR